MLCGTWPNSYRSAYFLLWVLAELLGLVAVILIAVVYNEKLFPGGYNWAKSPFGYHPLMMTIGFLFFYGNAILSYRTLNRTKKLTVKVLHAILLVVALALALVGLTAIIRNKNMSNPPRPHFMSFHSWIGLITIILFVFQWICGFVSFLFPTLSLELRQRYMPSHRLWGKAIFLSAVAAILTGLSGYGASSVFFVPNDEQQTRRFLLIFFGLFTSGFCFVVIYLLETAEFQRPPDENNGK